MDVGGRQRLEQVVESRYPDAEPVPYLIREKPFMASGQGLFQTILLHFLHPWRSLRTIHVRNDANCILR